MKLRALLICLLLSSCDDDGDSTVPADAGGKLDFDAEVRDARAEVDARTVDATSDASAAGCTLDQKYAFGYEGGLIAWSDHFELEQGYLTKSRESTARFDAGNGSCRFQLERCDGLADAFRNADVLAAFSDKDEVLGNDPRIVDGSVLVIEREDGKKIMVGSGCNDAPTCTPIPTGVQVLKTNLTRLIQQHDFAPTDAGAGLCR